MREIFLVGALPLLAGTAPNDCALGVREGVGLRDPTGHVIELVEK